MVPGALGARADQGKGIIGMTTIEDPLRLEFCYLTLPEHDAATLNIRVEGSELLQRYLLTYDMLIQLNMDIARALLMGKPS